MTRRPYRLLCGLLPILTTVSSQFSSDPRWLVPDASQADLSTSWNNADSITLSWEGLNSSVCDLWLTARNTSDGYAVRIASNIDIKNAGTLPWSIDVGNEQIQISDEFVLRFIPTGTTYHGAYQFVQVPSPGFVVLKKGSPATMASVGVSTLSTPAPTSTSAETAHWTTAAGTTATSQPSSTSTSNNLDPPPPPRGGSLSAGVKVGAAIAAVAALCVIVALLLWVVRLRRRVRAASNRRSQGIVPDKNSKAKPAILPVSDMEMTPHQRKIAGIHEVQGDKRQPLELSTKKERKSIYEMPG